MSTMICVFVEKSGEWILSYIYYYLPLAPIHPPLPPFTYYTIFYVPLFYALIRAMPSNRVYTYTMSL